MSTCFSCVVGLLALIGVLLGIIVEQRTGHPGMGYLVVLAFWAIPTGVAAVYLEMRAEREARREGRQ